MSYINKQKSPKKLTNMVVGDIFAHDLDGIMFGVRFVINEFRSDVVVCAAYDLSGISGCRVEYPIDFLGCVLEGETLQSFLAHAAEVRARKV